MTSPLLRTLALAPFLSLALTASPAYADPPAPAPAPAPAPSDGREKLEGAKLDALLADIANARRNVRTLRAGFTQERKLTLLATTVKSTGELAYVAPERLRWELAPPDDIVYLIGPEGLFGGDLSSLKDRYVLSGSRGPSDVEVSGIAKDKTASVRGFTLTLDKTLVLPVKAKLIEGKRDAIEITFSNAQVNVPIDPAIMKP
jgi:outer membrane lipoprotein-sorting protein